MQLGILLPLPRLSRLPAQDRAAQLAGTDGGGPRQPGEPGEPGAGRGGGGAAVRRREARARRAARDLCAAREERAQLAAAHAASAAALVGPQPVGLRSPERAAVHAGPLRDVGPGGPLPVCNWRGLLSAGLGLDCSASPQAMTERRAKRGGGSVASQSFYHPAPAPALRGPLVAAEGQVLAEEFLACPGNSSYNPVFEDPLGVARGASRPSQ